jgi:hypothetical protein
MPESETSRLVITSPTERGAISFFTTGLIVVIALHAHFAGPPPLDNPPDASSLNADPRPDWYLLR